MPGMRSAFSSRSCQLRGASVRATAGTYVERAGAVAAGAVVVVVVVVAGAGVGAGLTGVATVVGAEHDTTANDRRMIDDSGFMSDLVFQKGDSGK